ncbi:ATP-binding protein [Amycolatopsis sp. WQ 127309]|uniref:ATP-binding response regulator n=1 Tax=Amycolatopsis sp. WQ 127309 TaxID=2932773 RepID=UPI001FF2079C|nr:ATP-binding protein [Amycolatopsis sp. WQ 127309]UOZ07115.1 ATP-binding protein [Amycolatopsis sp. WQ 127309]
MTTRQRDELIRLPVGAEPDVFTIRRCGREVAVAVGLESQDQIRVATVLSDIGRDLVHAGATATVRFLLKEGPPTLAVEFSWLGAEAGALLTTGRDTAERLLDGVHVTHEAGQTVVTLHKLRSPAARPLTNAELDRLRGILAQRGVSTPMDELRAQNQELLETLESLEAKGKELTRLNEELEETNHGVVALYKELSEELEETNRGVVALYAELNEKSSQLKAASEAKTRFWSNISHELRGPINSVIGLARLLTGPGADPLTEEQRHQVGLVGDAGSTLLSLVNELLDTAKAESGRLVAQPAQVDLTAVCLQLRGALRSTVPSPEVELVIEEPDPAPPVVTDETMLVRILRNLLSNSLKFTESGEVRLRIDADDEDVRFTVSDTGIGIPADQQDRVFEEFHQVHSDLQAASPGTGLGLPYARRLAEILGGGLTLDSEHGRGTTVVLLLPRPDPTRTSPARVDSLLIVDDDADFRDRLARLVHGVAAGVRHAADGREAIEALDGYRPDLIFLDLFMPGMNGKEVLQVLREKPGSRDIPVVVVTSSPPDGLDLTGAGLRAGLLLKSQVTQETLRLAIGEAFAVVARTVTG